MIYITFATLRGTKLNSAVNRARILAKQWNPVPAILHREAPCLKRHIFLIRDLTRLKLIHGVMFRPKLYTNGLS
jgi:hypothetical protein